MEKSRTGKFVVGLELIPESGPFTWANDGHPYIENGLFSYRANNCLREAGISAKKEAVIKALNNGDLFRQPANVQPAMARPFMLKSVAGRGANPKALNKSHLRVANKTNSL